MEGHLHCEFCDKVNISLGYETIRIFTQKCNKCSRVSINKIIKIPLYPVNTIVYYCRKCGKTEVSEKDATCTNCHNIKEETNNHTIMCCYCQIIPKSLTILNDNTIICGICNRKFHPNIIKNNKKIAAHPHEDKTPIQCNICNG